MAFPSTPEYKQNQSPCSFGSGCNAQDDGADSENGTVAKEVDATFDNDKLGDLAALDDQFSACSNLLSY